MKVSEIAKAVGQENAEVAAAFGIETTQGYWLKEVDDKAAADYLATHGAKAPAPKAAEQVSGKARFWCKGRKNRLEGDATTKHDTIVFDEWVFECDGKSEEAKLLRVPSAWARFGVAEIYQKPYDNPGKIADFIRFIEGLMYTGPTPQDGVSREGHKSALALLTPAQKDAIPKLVRNRPGPLARAIAGMVSLSVELGGEE